MEQAKSNQGTRGMVELTAKERLTRQLAGEEVDRVPAIGGWFQGADNMAEIGGMPIERYLADPWQGVVRANRALGVDGMVQPCVPQSREEIRSGAITEQDYAGRDPDELLAAAEARYRGYFERAFRQWDGLVPVPNFWEIGGPFPLYRDFGYEAFLMACALYPEAVGKIWWSRCVVARERARLLVPLYEELDLVPVMFCGEDLCTNQGPMVSVDFLRQHYFPHTRLILEPLLEAGIKLVYHCDGDVRPILDDIFQLGYSGLQGFQYEVGIEVPDLRRRARAHGVEQPIFFAGLNVTRTLPFGDVDDVRAEVDYVFNATDGGRGMFLFTSNVTGVEVPPDNLRAGYSRLRQLTPGQPTGPSDGTWPNAHLVF